MILRNYLTAEMQAQLFWYPYAGACQQWEPTYQATGVVCRRLLALGTCLSEPAEPACRIVPQIASNQKKPKRYKHSGRIHLFGEGKREGVILPER
jgi:hypothetical protein